jgi:hypothetical protein
MENGESTSRTPHPTFRNPIPPDEALRHIEALSFPRRTGTPGEAQAQEYIIKRFKAMGMDPVLEEFQFTPVLGLLSKGFLLMALLLLTAVHLLSPFQNSEFFILNSILCILLLVMILAFLWGRPVVALLGWALFCDLPFLKKVHSKNIMSTWPVCAEQARPQIPAEQARPQIPAEQARPQIPAEQARPLHVYLLAHYDSKSQTLPLGLRLPLVAVSFLSTLFLTSYYLLMPLMGLPVQGMAGRGSFIVALTSGLMLLWTKTRNLSQGAIDNASGVAVMLQLAEAIKREAQRFKGLKFHFVATGAEEEGLVGAFWLCKSLGRGDPSASGGRPYVINLDGVGTKGRVYCTSKVGLHLLSPGQKELVALIRETAEKGGLRVYSPPLVIGAMADHFPFATSGYDAVTFSVVSRRSLWVHTSWDTPEMVEKEGIEIVERLVLELLKARGLGPSAST